MAADVPTTCPHCKHTFAAPSTMVGGLANCPSCGKAAEVKGMHDPLWRAMQIGAVVVAVGVGWLVAGYHGPAWGVMAAAGAMVGFWVISRAM